MSVNDYYIGLDMGTNTVGWAVTDPEYHLIRKKGKDMWGVREFDEANSAAERRAKRVARRNRQREQVRNGMLKSFFEDAVIDVDPRFFARLENSKYHECDKDEPVRTPNGVFNDTNYKDKDYFKQYPTIFHLRKELIENPEPHDVRLVYLAILNMFKHRGHFLNEGLRTEDDSYNIHAAYLQLMELLSETAEIEIPDIDGEILESILSDRTTSRSEKARRIAENLKIAKSQKRETMVINLMCGLKVDVSALFLLETEEKISVSFSEFGYEDKETEIKASVGDDNALILEELKKIYDTGILAGILKGVDYLSVARVGEYEKHKADLAILKKVFKKYLSQEDYDYMFRLPGDGTYSAYVNSVNSKEAKRGTDKVLRRSLGKRKKDDFYALIKKYLKKLPENDPDVKYIADEVARETFMPKQLTSANGVIPNQVHAKELRKILKNAETYLPFLLVKDETELTISEKILQLFSFQIPYYVGPVTENSARMKGNGWVVRREEGQVLPWNFKEKIDIKATSEQFISRMVRMCSYMNGKTVLPKASLMYERFSVLNEINNLKINDRDITVELKQDIFNDLFCKGKKVTRKQLVTYLVGRGVINQDSEVSGIDTAINSALLSYGKFKAIFGNRVDTDSGKKMVEDIIYWCTVYGDSKNYLKEQLREKYPEVTEAEIKRITGLKFKDWGRISREFLEMQGVDKSTGEVLSLLSAMWEYNLNMMELISSDQFTYAEILNEQYVSNIQKVSDITPDLLDEYYFSAPVKRMIWQTIQIVKEIEKIMKCAPQRVFIEMTRSDNEKGDKGRTTSRKQQMLDLYKSVKDDTHNWKELIEASDASGKLRSKKMYLYLCQMGRDMYTGKPIELSELFNDNLYDIDHIYPRHFVKDDNLNNNMVLVYKPVNARKSDTYPLDMAIRSNPEVVNLWKMLREKKMITEEKYRRLTGSNPFTEEQQASFIARQLVETGQGTKGVADFLKSVMPHTQIVYSKAANVSRQRQQWGLLKSRAANDFHHAKDAYMNIVVGNVYYTKFTQNPLNFIRKEYMLDKEKYSYHLGRMFDRDVERNGYIAWKARKDGDEGTLSVVMKTMAKNTPIITKQCVEGKGALANETLYGHNKAGTGSGYIPLKSSDEKIKDISRYGGFTSASTAYFFLVEHDIKKKRVRTLETVPVYMKERIEKDPKVLEQYCEDELGLKNSEIKLRKIKLKSLVKVNQYYVFLAGKTGNQVILHNAVSLCLGQNWINYIHKLEKYSETAVLDRTITLAENTQLYDVLTQKFRGGIFTKRLNPVGDKLLKGRERFVALSEADQCYILLQIMKLVGIGPVGADLVKIGESAHCGVLLMSKEISKYSEIQLINQSCTGLFETKTDLLSV